MPRTVVDGVGLHWEQTGSTGPRLVLVHGAWVDSHNWDEFVPVVAERFRVLTYDRRGHGESDRPDVQGRMQDDVNELARLLEAVDFSPAHLVGNSYGGMVALRLVADRPELVESVTAHEPPFLHLNARVMAEPAVAEVGRIQRELATLPEQSDLDSSIGRFMDAVIGPGAWNEFPEEFRAYLRANAPSFVDDVNDPDPWSVDLDRLRLFAGPMLLTRGESSPEWYRVIVDEIIRAVPAARGVTVPEAGHGPHIEQPFAYARLVADVVGQATDQHASRRWSSIGTPPAPSDAGTGGGRDRERPGAP